MIEPSKFARCFFETFDKGAVAAFQSWLATQPFVDRWIIGADFALRDKTRPEDCFAFSIIPYDKTPGEFTQEVRLNLAKDLKKSKTLDAEGSAWLRDNRHFHILIPMKQDQSLYNNKVGAEPRAVVRESLALLLPKLIEMERGDDQIRRFKAVMQKAKANSFNVGLFTDLTLLALYLAIITVLLCREHKPKVVCWFCDRDNMTNFNHGIVWDYAMENFQGIAELFQVDVNDLKPVIAVPDRSSGEEVMWFDHYIRAADWLAGALAAWDRSGNLVPTEHDKYLKLIEDVVADSQNIIVLPVHLDETGVRISRLIIGRQPSVKDATPGIVLPSS